MIQKAWAEWPEFKESFTPHTKSLASGRILARKEGWKTAERGVIKLNISSSCGKNGSQVGLGVAARDHSGVLFQIWAVFLDYTANPVIAKLEADRVALVVAQQNGWRKVEIQ